MKKILFSLFIIVLLVITLLYKGRAEDLAQVNRAIVSCISQSPKVSEVFCISGEAVET